MTWEEFKKALEALENGGELLEYHAGALDKEKQFGIQKYSEKDKEAAKLRKFKSSLKELGWDGESDPDEFVNSVKDKMEGRQNESNSALSDLTKQLKNLQKEFDKTQTELQTEREQKTSLQKQNKIKTIESVLTPKLSESFYGSQFIIKALIADGQVDLSEEGQVIFKNGDKTLDLDAGIKMLGETHADARKNTQKPGAGSQPANMGSKAKYTPEQLNSMTAEQAAADIVNYNASLKAHAGK
jgi:hypothetical protein